MGGTTQAGLFQTSEVYKSALRWQKSGFGKYFDRQNLYKDLGGLSRLRVTIHPFTYSS